MMLSIFCCNVVEIGKTLLKKVILDKADVVWKVWKVVVFVFRFELDIDSSCKYRLFVGFF